MELIHVSQQIMKREFRDAGLRSFSLWDGKITSSGRSGFLWKTL